MKRGGKNPYVAEELTVGEVAAQSGVAVSAIHFYESRGLIGGRRTAGNRLRYPRAMIKRVLMIRSAQSAGIPLSAVRDILKLYPDKRAPAAADWQLLKQRWLDELDVRIARLAELRDQLTYCSACGCLLPGSCPLIAAAAARSGR